MAAWPKGVAVLGVGALWAAAAMAGGGVYSGTRHGDPDNGVLRIDSEARGECTQCHDLHASRDGVANGGPFPYALFAENDNALCQTCHDTRSANAIYPGSGPWGQSAHALSPSMSWPGPTPPSRPSSDSGKCVNCHDPHGQRDAGGLVPSLLHTREENLCYSCHDGTPGANVRQQFQKAFTHPITRSGRHSPTEGDNAGAFGNRHSECVDCHSAHVARRDNSPAGAPDASETIVGVSRIKVTNGPAGTRPVYTWAGPDEVAFAMEYEVCFKCHSSWTSRPAGQEDLALVLNPNNPSFHPVEAEGANRNIEPDAFVNGWRADSLVYCSDCHGGDNTTLRGPHGSAFRYLLKANYEAATSPSPMSPGDLCFRCHSWDTYTNPVGDPAQLRASRFNGPSAPNGHAFHVGDRGFTCYACHQSHGSTQLPGLIATGRSPGLLGYVQTPTGGTCTTTCHGSESYAVNYPR
jgi:predicted CXXCH cytochrome family protein